MPTLDSFFLGITTYEGRYVPEFETLRRQLATLRRQLRVSDVAVNTRVFFEVAFDEFEVKKLM